MKVAIIGGDIGSGGLISMLKGLLEFDPINYNIEVVLYCTFELYKSIPKIGRSIKVIKTNELRNRKLKDLFFYKYSKKFTRIIDELSPDLIFYISGTKKRGLEKYKSLYILNNQFYTNKSMIIRQGLSVSTIVLLIKALHESKSIDNSDAVIFSSKYSFENSIKNNRIIKNSKVILLSCNDFFKRSNKYIQKIRINDEIKIIYIASIIPYKNQLVVLKAINILLKNEYNIKLTLVGKVLNQKYYKKCRKYINSNNINSKIEFIPWIEHHKLPDLINKNDIFLNASSIDTCGTSICEGMALNIPVIASRNGFNSEIMRNFGYYFNENDEYELANSIVDLIKDPIATNSRIVNANMLVKDYGLKDAAKLYYDYINELLFE